MRKPRSLPAAACTRGAARAVCVSDAIVILSLAGLWRGQRREGEAHLFARIVDYLASVIQDHGGALRSVVGRPRKSLLAGIASARERDPRAANLGRERIAVFARAGHRLSSIRIVEDEWDFHAMHGLQLAFADGRTPFEVIHVSGRLSQRGFAFGGGNGVGPGERIGS